MLAGAAGMGDVDKAVAEVLAFFKGLLLALASSVAFLFPGAVGCFLRETIFFIAPFLG